MDKYYTPEIEEFHVGFEYEVQSNEDSTEFEILTIEKNKRDFEFLNRYALNNINYDIRVKYLDREDIESLGFTFKTEDGKTDLFINFKLNVSIIYNFETKVLRMITMDLAKSELYHEIQTDPHRIGGIIIKNKSEFKKLLTQLGLSS